MATSTQRKLEELRAHLWKVSDLRSAGALLGWDQATYMPEAGAPARARQMAALEEIAHEKATSPVIGRLLDELQSYADALPYDHDDAALLRVTRRAYDLSLIHISEPTRPY